MKKTALVLSIDQYFYFLEAFQKMPLNYITNHQKLREFCKIFWLNDHRFESEFDQIFKSQFNKDEIRNLLNIEEEEEGTNQTTTNDDQELDETISIQEPADDQEKDGQDEIEQLSGGIISEEFEEFLEFDLVITEGNEQGIEVDQREGINEKSTFMMEDQIIMPFQLRFFAQRLRRVIESSVLTWSDELDIEKMVTQYCNTRYFEDIIYKKRLNSSSNVVLLADRYGSMLSYEFIEQQLADAIRTIPGCHFEHLFFYDLPYPDERTGHYKFKPVNYNNHFFDTEKHTWDGNTWIFIFSDAGAHSGLVNKPRMRATFQMWDFFKNITPHVHWINPVPKKFFGGTTAERLSYSIPMIYPVQEVFEQFFDAQ